MAADYEKDFFSLQIHPSRFQARHLPAISVHLQSIPSIPQSLISLSIKKLPSQISCPLKVAEKILLNVSFSLITWGIVAN